MSCSLLVIPACEPVIPAKAGTQWPQVLNEQGHWVTRFAHLFRGRSSSVLRALRLSCLRRDDELSRMAFVAAFALTGRRLPTIRASHEA
jgi:hypothetical protein